jgi:DNA helicase-2/ATP-dependent DNA helicase PcrA
MFRGSLRQLNPEQQKAVHTTEGRVLILAGAGTGKTKVLTERIVYLVQEKDVPPESILGLTFTNKAAQEMRHRLGQYLSQSAAQKVSLGTFHSFCLQVLREHIHHLGFTKEFSLYNEKEIERAVKRIVHDLLEHSGALPSLEATMEAISFAVQKGRPLEDFPSATWHDRFVKEVYQRLKVSLRAYNSIGLDHLLSYAVELFESQPSVLQLYQNKYRYVMIDEYQDTNPIQLRLAELLTSVHQNLCVVGDDDQAIYGWRGADVDNILSFPYSTLIKLEKNYRSSGRILSCSNQLIVNNRSRHSKTLWCEQEEGEKLEVFVAPDAQKEAQAVGARIAKLKQTLKLPWKEIAILYRSNALSREMEKALLQQPWECGEQWRKGIPYQISGGTEFYERREIKDLLAYLAAIINPHDQEAILRIVNVPRRGIGDVFLDKLTAYSRSSKKPLVEVMKEACLTSLYELTPKEKQKLKNFLSIIEEGAEKLKSKITLKSWLEELITRIDFKKSIFEEVKSEAMRAFKWGNVQAFVDTLSEFEAKDPSSELGQFISMMLLNEGTPFSKCRPEVEDKVQLMTFHSAKGLEFKVCFLIGIEDHLIPHEKSVSERGLEEERRLMYVALTRAKKKIYLSMAKTRERMGQPAPSKPSRFLSEIERTFLDIVAWDVL